VRSDGPSTQEQRLQVSVALYCQECRQPWQELADRWRIYLTDSQPPRAITYCRSCAQREFGD
jgi:RNase P subunit RPR2